MEVGLKPSINSLEEEFETEVVSSPGLTLDWGQRISQRVSEFERPGVIFVNVDDFGKLCATHPSLDGARINESLLQTCKGLVPEKVECYRIPRTGFLFLVETEVDEADLENLAQQLIDRTKSPFEIDGESFSVSFSIGLATVSSEEEPGLVDRAQFAQQSAQNQEGSGYEFYDSKKVRTTRDEISMTTDLYTALEDDEFFLTYQPIVSLEDYTVCGAEALIRWDHPERGLVSPGEFIPLAEKTGQILFIDRWVIKNAIRQAAEWSEEFDRKLPVGINISAWQFRDDYLVKKIGEIFEETNLDPSLIKIEVTETSVMQDVEHTGRVLRELKDLGVQVALDDFGTGHATFEYLSQFPIDELKIDRSFLDFNDIYAKNQQLVEIMIQTGQRIGTNILAEGIETPDQLTYLRNRGCERAQGFLFSKPVREKEFRSLVREHKPLYQSSNN